MVFLIFNMQIAMHCGTILDFILPNQTMSPDNWHLAWTDYVLMSAQSK